MCWEDRRHNSVLSLLKIERLQAIIKQNTELIGVITLSLTLEQKRRIIRVTTVIGVFITIIGAIFISRSHYFRPNGGFSNLLLKLGFFSPVIFILVQVSQIIYPIIPLGLTNVIGDLIFGHFWGFVFNCTGMFIGSSINFFFKEWCSFPLAFISDEQYAKYRERINRGDGLRKLLIVGFLLPLFPDDIFCTIAGMSKIKFKDFFFKIVVLYRPISLFIFTYMTSTVIQWLAEFFLGGNDLSK